MTPTPSAVYRPPSWFDRRIFNPLIARLSSLGLSFAVGPGSPVEELARIAPDHPVFLIEP